MSDDGNNVVTLPGVEVLPPEPRALEPVNNRAQLEDDTTLVRNNLREMIDTGKKALDDAKDIAYQSGDPESYEMLASMIKAVAGLHRDLVNLHKSKRSLGAAYERPQTINNTLILTTTELHRMLNDIRDDKVPDEPA